MIYTFHVLFQDAFVLTSFGGYGWSTSYNLCAANVICTTPTGASIDLHVNETTITFPFAEAQAKEIVAAINNLLQTFAAKQAAERPKRWQSMEYRYKGALYSIIVEKIVSLRG